MEDHQMSVESVQWRETEPDVSVQELDQLLRQTNWANAVAYIQNAMAGVTVYFTKQCEQAIKTHLETEPYELGGLLLGRVFKANFISAAEYPWITLVEKSA
jgi:hypothetical protein